MYQIPGTCISVVTNAAMSDKYKAVKLGANGLVLASANTDVVIGVLQRQAIASEAATVMVDGITMMKASAAIAKGALVTTDANGDAVTWTENNVIGIALEAASAANDIIPVLLRL
ncbi:MAG: DUF2190 family protein [Eubacteriales bacterium]